jgi:hypothetical protein
VDATAFPRAVSSGAPNASATARASNGILDAMPRGRNARGGILSLMSGIGMRFPATSSRSLKNLPGSAAHFITCSSVDAANDSADVLSWW